MLNLLLSWFSKVNTIKVARSDRAQVIINMKAGHIKAFLYQNENRIKKFLQIRNPAAFPTNYILEMYRLLFDLLLV